MEMELEMVTLRPGTTPKTGKAGQRVLAMLPSPQVSRHPLNVLLSIIAKRCISGNNTRHILRYLYL